MQVPAHMWKFAEWQPRLAGAAKELEILLVEMAQSGSIQYHQIEARAKALDSYHKKAEKCTSDGKLKYSDPLHQIYDCIAARVIFFTKKSEEDFVSQLESRSSIFEHVNPGDSKHNGYDSEHFVVSNFHLTDGERARFPALAEYFEIFPGAEIQLRTVAGHAWAEYEHDVRYKPGGYARLSAQQRAEIDQRFSEAGGLRRFIDQLFSEIDQLLESAPQLENQSSVPEFEPSVDSASVDGDLKQELRFDSLEQYCSQRYPESSFGDSRIADELISQLIELGIGSIEYLDSMLTDVDVDGVADLMSYRVPPSAVRRLDDEILSVLLGKWVESAPTEPRKSQLGLRVRRLQGKFTIYSVSQSLQPSKYGFPLTASQALREVAVIAADELGISGVEVSGFVSASDDIPDTSRPRFVQAGEGRVYVAARVTRDQSEAVMGELIGRLKNSPVGVFRAGDLILASSAYKDDISTDELA